MVSQAANTTPQRPSIQELKKKYESNSSTCNSEVSKTSKPKSPKLLKKFKVKQMANMFNNKVAQIVKSEAHSKGYNTLVRELSADGEVEGNKPNTLPKPLPLPRTRYTKEKVPVPSPRSKSLARLQRKPSCFVAEDAFAKMSVKDKAQLYTQFVSDMSRKNPKFVEHVEALEANIKKEVARGEVVNEKQESVKNLLANLEARCVFPKQRISPDAVERLNSVRQPKMKGRSLETPIKSKEFEDLVKPKVSHISTLTITLQSASSSPVKQRRESRSRSLPRRRCEVDQIVNLNISEPCYKRHNEKMRTTLSIEAYAPPKKIRRTRAEHLAPPHVFQNQHLETLFYSWLKERHEESMEDVRAEEEDEEQVEEKSAVDKLLEEAIAKLETVKIQQKQEKEEAQGKQNPVEEVPKHSSLSSEVSTTSSAKQTDGEESESGISQVEKVSPNGEQFSLEKVAQFPDYSSSPQPTTDDSSQAQNHNDSAVFAKPLKPLRKKKMRRSLSWRKDSSLVETNTISSTDSETDNPAEKPLNKVAPNMKIANNEKAPQEKPLDMTEGSFSELDKSLIQSVNSPRKIKSAYTLTVCTPMVGNEAQNQREQLLQADSTMIGNSGSDEKKTPELPRSLTDSFDQGFETGSNDIESPIRMTRKTSLRRLEKPPSAPLFVKLDQEKKSSDDDVPSSFSTPVKSLTGSSTAVPFNESGTGARQQIFSPIGLPLKQQRRRSIYDAESRRSSLAMQVIREDHPLEHHEIQSPRFMNSQQVFFSQETSNHHKLQESAENSSKFWINCGDCSMSLEIHRNEKERVQLLYEIFSQRSCDTKDLHFGIDGYKFAVHEAPSTDSEDVDILKRLPHQENCSQYWFSTGDLAVPFAGKRLSQAKIQRIFQFIKSSVEETGILRFGVDHMEFSNVPEFWSQSPKFSMESNYSMLVGLQSGTSNGLEGRSKYAWPHSKPIPVSDLDQSDFESDIFDQEEVEEEESGRLSLSPFGSNHFDLASLGAEDLMMPRNSDAMRFNSDSFGKDYENESLDHLFEEKKTNPTIQEKSPPMDSVPEMLNVLKNQHERLSSVKERLSNYHNPTMISCETLDALQGKPEYLTELKKIVADIGKLGSSDSFKSCSLEELERYMFFLSRYADICLNSCSNHMDKILDALLDQRAVYV
ncbi:uncharacterized protein LOC133333034 [Musca vetustissima]|uniref:uncharacterized protein LOC133333034 n=1 Tax=Musca vetustissima TaxID=27455 RepID=UPI002AB7BAD7|nr:uncharacterized protein LOC133333034 [Musca vetustissima]